MDEHTIHTETETVDKKPKKKLTLKDQIELLEQEIKELKDKNLRVVAEYENARKRLDTQRIQDRKYASKYLIDQLLTPLSQLDKIVELPTEDEKLKNFLIGFKMIKDQIFKTLEADGLKEIEALNRPFDPNFHEAMEKIHDQSLPNGINVAVINKGYMYKEQLLKPATVKVNEWSEENGENK
jgi:molecular chaperone GrpE